LEIKNNKSNGYRYRYTTRDNSQRNMRQETTISIAITIGEA